MGQYEDIIFGNLGQFGLFQIFIFLACNIAETPASWAMTIMSFAGAKPDWWSLKQVYNATGNFSFTMRQFQVCPDSENETIEFSSEINSIVSEWSLICDKDWIPSAITTIQMSGVLTGAFLIGQLGDLVGRKKCFFSVYFLMMLFSFLSSFSPNWQTFAAFRFFIGATLGGFLIVSFTLPMEYVGTRWRTFVGSCPSWAIGIAALGPLAYFLPDWRKLSIAIAVIGSPLLLTYWFVPESCRWLLVHGRIEEAEQVIKRMAKINRRPMPDLSGLKYVMTNEQDKVVNTHRYSLIDLLKNWNYLKKVFLLGFMFFSVVQGYYGFTLGVVQLAGNRYLNMSLSGIVEAGAVLTVLVISHRLKRQKTTMSLFIIAGLSSLAIGIGYFVVSDATFPKLQNGLSLSAKFFLSGAFVSLLITTSEAFPTVIRNLGYGTVSTCGRVGGLIAPQIIYIYKLNKASPYLVFGAMLVLSGILCLLNTDTYDTALEDQMEAQETRSPRLSKTCAVGAKEANGGTDLNSKTDINQVGLVSSSLSTRL